MMYNKEVELNPTDLFCIGHGVCAYLTGLKQFISAEARFADQTLNHESRDSFNDIDQQCGKIIAVLERLTLDPEYLKLLLPNGDLYVKKGDKTLIASQAMKMLLLEVWYSSFEWKPSCYKVDLPYCHYYNDFDPYCDLPLAIIIFLNSFTDLISQVDRNIICDDMNFVNMNDLLEKYHYGITLKAPEYFKVPKLVDLFKKNGYCQSIKSKHFPNIHSNQSTELVKLGNKALKSSKPLGLSYYSQALVFSPDDAIILSNRAAMFQELDSHEDAIKDLLKCVRLQKDFSVAYARLAFSYLFLGNAFDSIKNYVNSIKACQGLLMPDNINIQSPSNVEEYQRKIKSKTLPSYLHALVRSLKLAEERALQQGLSQEVVYGLSSDIESIISTVESRSNDNFNRRSFRANIPFPMGQGSIISFDLNGDPNGIRASVNPREITPRNVSLSRRMGDVFTNFTNNADVTTLENTVATGGVSRMEQNGNNNTNATTQNIANPFAVVLEGLLTSGNTALSTDVARAITNTLIHGQAEAPRVVQPDNVSNNNNNTSADANSNGNDSATNSNNNDSNNNSSSTNSNNNDSNNNSSSTNNSNNSSSNNNNSSTNSNNNNSSTSSNNNDRSTNSASSNNSSGSYNDASANNASSSTSGTSSSQNNATDQNQPNIVSSVLERILTSSGSPLSPEVGRAISRSLVNGQLPDGATIVTAITENGGPMRFFNLNNPTGANNNSNSNNSNNNGTSNNNIFSSNNNTNATANNNNSNNSGAYNDTSHLEDINDIE